jgi:uncharacterized pyridoxamine 5'-phosphate oxidase family protein
MQEIVKFLQENINGFLATVDDGTPRVRFFQFMMEEGGKLFFCTNSTKEVFKQLKANPFIEFSSSTPNFAWIRLRGKAEFSNDLSIKAKILDTSKLVKSIYRIPIILFMKYSTSNTGVLSSLISRVSLLSR